MDLNSSDEEGKIVTGGMKMDESEEENGDPKSNKKSKKSSYNNQVRNSQDESEINIIDNELDIKDIE